MGLAFLAAPAGWLLGPPRNRRGLASVRQPFMRAPRLVPHTGGLTRLLDGRMDELALPRREGTMGHLPRALLIGEPVPHLELHGQDPDGLTCHFSGGVCVSPLSLSLSF